MSSAAAPQKPSGSRIDRAKTSSYTLTSPPPAGRAHATGTMSPRGRSPPSVAGRARPGARQWPAPHEYTAKRVGGCGPAPRPPVVAPRPRHRAHRSAASGGRGRAATVVECRAMKFLCLDCDEPMKLLATEGPEDGSLAVTFRCPECGFRVAMLTNQFETQMVKSLGVKVGGRTEPAQPFEHLRASMAQAPDLGGAIRDATGPEAAAGGPGCPFAAMLAAPDAAAPARVLWSPDAAARVDRIPAFIRPMAKTAIERYAEGKGHPTITEAVMDEARAALGM